MPPCVFFSYFFFVERNAFLLRVLESNKIKKIKKKETKILDRVFQFLTIDGSSCDNDRLFLAPDNGIL